MLPKRGWLRQMTDTDKLLWWAIGATGDTELALRAFRRDQRDRDEPSDRQSPGDE